MNSALTYLIAIFILGVTKPTLSEILSSQRNLELADSLFKGGHFEQAEEFYSKILTYDSTNYQATLRLGFIALLGNRHNEAQKWLSEALRLKPEERTPKRLLSYSYYL